MNIAPPGWSPLAQEPRLRFVLINQRLRLMTKRKHSSGKIVLMMALAGLSVCSACTKYEEDAVAGVCSADQAAVVPGTHFITAGFPEEDGKVTLSPNGHNIYWVVGDILSIFDGTGSAGRNDSWVQGVQYRCSSLDDKKGSVATFSNVSAEVASDRPVYYAHYPYYSGGEVLYGSGYIHSWITYNQCTQGPGTLPITRNSTVHLANAVAKSDSKDGPFYFKNIHSLLRFTVPASDAGCINQIAVSVYANQDGVWGVPHSTTDYLSGDLLVDYGGDSPDVELTYNRYGDKFTGVSHYTQLNLYAGNASSDTFGAGQHQMVMAPRTIKHGLHLSFYTTEDDASGSGTTYIYERIAYGQRTFARNTPYNMGTVGRPGATAKAATGITFPYVFSFRTDGGDKGQQYLSVSSGSYDASSASITDVLTDVSTGAGLTGVSCHQSGSNVNSWTGYVKADPAGRDAYSRNGYACSFPNTAPSPMQKEAGIFLTFPLAEDAPDEMNLYFGLSASEWSSKNWRVFYTTDKNGYWCRAGDLSVSGAAAYDEFSVTIAPPASMLRHLKKGNTLFVKIVPIWRTAAGGSTSSTAVGHGNSCIVNLFSCVALTARTEESTAAPLDAVWFEAFDANKDGLDYRIGYATDGTPSGKLGSLANKDGGEQSLSGWTCEQVRIRPGYAQIGYVNSNGVDPSSWTCSKGTLTSPVFASSGNFRLSFKAMAYKGNARGVAADYLSPDLTSIRVVLNGGGTFTTNSSTSMDLTDISISAFDEITLDIQGAVATTTVSFTSPDANFTRWFIDDICLKRL